MEEPIDRQQGAASTGASKERSRRRRRCDNCNARLRGRFCIRCGQRDAHYDRVVCDNCGAEKLGHYCAVCGQSDRNYRRSVFPIVGQVLSETFEIDSRLLKTVPRLLFRPGFLSLEFSRNRRAGYLSPFRLYLFTSIVFFFVLSLSVDLPAGPGVGREFIRTGEGPVPIDLDRTERERPWLRISIGGDEEQPPGRSDPTDARDAAEAPAASVDTATTPPPGSGGDGAEARAPPDPSTGALTAEQQEAIDRLAPALDEDRRRKLTEILRSSVFSDAVVQGARQLSVDDTEGTDATQRYVIGQLIDILHRPWDAVQTWFENLPVAMFCLLPLFALLLKLVYPRSGRFYAEHLVFAMHNHTVAFLAFTVMVLLPEESAAAGMTVQLLMLALVLYYFVGMRRFYGGGRFVTAVKFLLLLNLYGFLLIGALAGAAGAVLLLF